MQNTHPDKKFPQATTSDFIYFLYFFLCAFLYLKHVVVINFTRHWFTTRELYFVMHLFILLRTLTLRRSKELLIKIKHWPKIQFKANVSEFLESVILFKSWNIFAYNLKSA